MKKKRKNEGPDIRVAGFPCDVSGCGKYRMVLPLHDLSAHKKIKADIIHHFFRDLPTYANYNSIFLQRQCSANQVQLINGIFRMKRSMNSPLKVVYECDDLFHEIEPENKIAYEFYDEGKQQNIEILMERADVVSFSTEFLRDYYEDLIGLENTMVIENSLPKWLWRFPERKKEDVPSYKNRKIKILWSGSSSHHGKTGDTAILNYLMKKTKKKWGDRIRWVFFGTVPDFVDSNSTVIGWKPFWEYPMNLYSIGADIGLIPIKECDFNRGKSDLKLQEFGACGIPSICSKIGNGPYRNAPISCENDPKKWMDRIEKLVTNPRYYLKIRREQYKNIRWLDKYHQKWKKLVNPFGG